MSYKLIKKEKKFNRTKISAYILLVVLAFAFMINARADPPPPYPKISNLTIDPTTADVGESVNITWTIIGFFDIAVVSYGDGNQTQMTMVQENDTYTIYHEYENEGKYNVSIYVANTATGYEDWDGQFITVQNDPPVFDISLDPSQADEDQLVNVSVTNLQESDHDKEPGLLNYVYDFGNGNQTTSNSSSILHKWENGGTYPVTVTVIDDQGALNQKTQDIVIGNKAPDPDFTIGSEIPSTYGFYSDLVGAFPFGWASVDKHYEATYSFEGDTLGYVPEGWSDTSLGNGWVEVVESWQNHNNVLLVRGKSGVDDGQADNTFSSQDSGTIEFWWGHDISGLSRFFIYGDTGRLMHIALNSNNFAYYNSSGYQNIASITTNKMYHIKLDFNCDTDTYNIYLDGNLTKLGAEFENIGSYITSLRFNCDGDRSSYIDAVGYSWDENYEIGDNEYAHESFDAFKVKEGADHHQKILEVIGDDEYGVGGGSSCDTGWTNSQDQMNQDVSSSMFWGLPTRAETQDDLFTSALLITGRTDRLYCYDFGFSIDSGATIDGIEVRFNKFDTTETNSEDYEVRLGTGSTSMIGDNKQTDSQWDTTDDDSYDVYGSATDKWGATLTPAIVNAMNFGIGLRAEPWSGPDAVPQVDHVQMKVYYTIGGGGGSSSNDVEIYNSFESQPNGTVEFWFMHNNVSTTVPISTFSFRDSTNDEEFALLIKNDEWYYRAGGSDTLLNIDHDPVNDTWHHVRVDFLTTGQYMGLSTNSFKVIIDQNESAQIGFSGDEITRLSITTDKGFSGRRAYIDAIGYSWDPNYEVGNNFHIFIKEYYATFDFREEIVGTAPDDEDWHIPPPPSSKDGEFSIIDAGGDLDDPFDDPMDEIVEITDNSTSVSLIMEHNYTDQAYGSVEFWVRSNNTSEKVWAFCLMQNEALALSVLMDEDEWKYTDNSIDYEIINGAIDPPEDDTWYHVRIDFRCNGADPYFSLQEGYFTVAIDTALSSQYQMASVTSINRTRVTTGETATGVAYMDAIGYSWDPYYEIGDNRYPMVHYPEKSLIWFSASQTTDTESDEGSLSYYWDFGDGSNDFGKYVAHEYITSGMYPVELTVMDDNGVKSSKTRIVLISNQYPDINFTTSQGEITIDEGTTVTFDTIVDDENADVARMDYYWHLDGDEFNPYNVSEYTQGGWINSYTFTDDHDGMLYAMAQDPENAFDFDAINVTVENVDPSVSISRLDMIANVTFEVERNGPPWYDNNFTFVILGTDDFDLGWPSLYEELNFTGSTDPVVNVKNEDVAFNLLKDWRVYVNTTSQISGTVQYTITLDFQDGQQGKMQSQEFSTGYAYWEPSLDSLWYDDTNFTIKHPVNVGVSMWDPSEDDLSLDLNYTIDMVVEIQCSDTLPISKSFDIDNIYFYDIEVYEQNGKKYANISAYTEVAVADAFNDYEFPVCINNASYLIDPMIDLTELLVTNVEGPLLDDFSVVECISALNVLDALTIDDDGGSNLVDVGFDTQNEVDVYELCPDITLIHKYGGLMEQNITFYLDYYYSSNSSSGASMVFEPISTYTPSEEQTQSSSYGSQAVDSGSDGDSGYASYDTTDSGWGDDSGYSAIGDIDLSGSDSGEGWDGTPVQQETGVSDTEADVISAGSPYTTGWTYSSVINPSDPWSSRNTDEDHFPSVSTGGYYSMHQYSGYSDVPGWIEYEGSGALVQVSTWGGTHDEVMEILRGEPGAVPQAKYAMGTRDDGYLEFWFHNLGTTTYFQLQDPSGAFKICFAFNDNGFYLYEWKYVWFLTWAWSFTLKTSAFEDNAWYRFGLDWDTSANVYKYWLWNEAGSQLYYSTTGHNLLAGTPYYVMFACLNTNGIASIDGFNIEYTTTPTLQGDNLVPMQKVQTGTYKMYYPNMDVDSFNRLNDFRISYTARTNIAADQDIYCFPYVYNGGGYTQRSAAELTSSYVTRNIEFSAAEKNTFIHSDAGGYYSLLYFVTKHNNYQKIDLDAFVFYNYNLKVGWKETYYTGGNKYYYYNDGQNANVEHDLTLPLTSHELTHQTSAKLDLNFEVSQAKTNMYVDLWDFGQSQYESIDGPFSLSAGGTKSITDQSFGLEYVDSDGDVKLRIRDTQSSGPPFTLEMNTFQVDWVWDYDYDSVFEIDLNNMNDFRLMDGEGGDANVFTSARIDYTIDSSAVPIDVDIYKWGTGWEESNGDFTGGTSASGYLTFTSNDYIDKDGSKYLVKIRFLLDDSEFEITSSSNLDHWYEWDYICDDEFKIGLNDMTSYRKSHLTNLDIPYSLDTSESKTLTFWAHNGIEYESITTIVTTGGVTKTGTIELDDSKYVYYDSGEYYVDVKFTGISDTSFEVNGLYADYSYSYTYDDKYELQLSNMNDFRYDNFDEGTINFQFDTDDSNHDADIYLWNWVSSSYGSPIKTIDGGSNKQGSIELTSANYSNYVDDATYKIKIKFGVSDTEFNLDSLSASWDYYYSYYDTYEVDLDEMTQFRYDYFDECTLDYQIDLPRAGKSTTVYLYNFTKSDWDYFTTTTGGGNDIQDSITFNTIDYIDSSSDKTRIKFTGFTDSEFNKDSIVANYSWEYDVQDKYYTVLSGMTPHEYDTFEKCNITYSLQTTEDQTLQVQLFNFTSSEWTSVGSPFNTIKDTEYKGSTLFTSDEFIHPTEYKTRIFFNGIQDSFLTLNSLENNYSQSHFYTYTDFGYDDQGIEGEPYVDMAAVYRNVYRTNHIFDYAGDYVVTWNVSDGRYETQVGELIEIIYPIPSVSIGDLPDIVLEDQEVLLESTIGFAEQYAQEAKYQFFWDFGDGHHSVDRDPLHRWSESDNYTVTLHVRDLYGNYYNDSVVVEVEEKYPEITGPYGFSGFEGQAITLDVAVSDSLFDRKDLTFTWYDENDQEITGFANNPKPIVILDDGVYNYSLEIEDTNGYTDSAEIIITVNDVPPSIFIKNYIYHGDANSGSLTLTAYAFDYSEDMNTLEFTWRISHNHTVDNRGPYSNVNRSSITFDATKTALYQGEVSVKDPSTNTINKQVFYISSVIDSNGNGFSDEFEEQLAENGENIYDYYDTDKDGISDLYEITNNQTDYLNPDTDRDGLYDGIDRSTGMGERPAGTNPIDYDSDDDLLSDGEEVYGWEISTDQHDVIYVSSDPWLNDTDGDGWTDYEEYLNGTHPRNVDTDLDGVNDPQDPFPLEADKDEDGLLDSEEIAIGTDCDNSDTDEDTLTDGEEVRGGITDPLSADTDRDFATDSAEIIVKQKSIHNRLSLDQPVVLSFDHYFQHAATAQISFVLAFGEFNGTINYGIENVPDLNVKVSKMDSNLVLYEGNTNGDRYFSYAIDFREVIEEKGHNYYGDYVISVDDTDAGCMLEQYHINIVGLLDPRDADYDNDGIMDGIEIDTLVRGTSIINFTSGYDNNNIRVNDIALPDPHNFNIEVGSVQLSNTIDQSVVAHITFENNFWFPVVVAYVNSRNEGDSVEVRVDNVTSSGCDIFMEEPGDGSHASETINYIVVEYGEWEFEDGTDIKAGIIATDQAHQGGSSYSNWEQVSFMKNFSADPVVLHSLNTYNNEDFKTSIVSAISTSSFNITQESAETGTSTSQETIGWIAIEAGKTGTLNNVKYETIQENDGDADGVDDNGHSFSFTNFVQTPLVVVSQNSANNVDGSWACSDGVLSASTHTTNAEEDQIGDSERNHPDEYFGLVAFEEEISYGYDYTPPQDPDFKVVRGTTIISSSSATATITEGTDYNLESGIDSSNCFIRITNTRIRGMGSTSGGSQYTDDFSAWIQNPDNIDTSITFERAGTTNDNRIDWEIIQYIGPSGGANEMIVRDIDTVTCGGTSAATCDGATIYDTITDSDKVVVFITGQKAVDTARADWYESLFTAELIDEGGNDYTPRFTRGKSVASDDGISYAVVEFKGSNWRDVQRLEVSTTCATDWSSGNYNTAYSDVTIQSEGGVDLLDYTKTFLHQQYRTNNDATGLDDAGDNIEIISNTQFRLRNAAHANERYKVVWIIENTQSSGTVMSVQHEWHYDASGGSEEETYTDTFTAVSSMDTTSVFACGSSDGGGTAYPRGSVNYRLTDTDTITFTHSDSGQPQIISYEVVEWPAESGDIILEEETPEPTDTNSFSIKIPDIGTVYDANVSVTVASENTPLGYGTVNITLFKEDINCNIDDVLLIDYDAEFNETDVNFNQFIDLTAKVNDETIHQFYGSYRLEIVIFDSSNEDVFNITQFSIETDTYVQASDSDQNVWITDPSNPDTDGDTVSDYDEIYGWTRGSDTFYTNPLSKDTDGDNAEDKIDRHPTENVMIKISPLSATHRGQFFWEASPKLEIAISYELNGDSSHKIFSPKIRATEDLWRAYIFPFWYSHYRRSNFAANDVHYYVDIDDNPNVQPEDMNFGFSLWHMECADFFGIPLWDTWLAGESVSYSLGDVGHSTTFDVYDVGIWGQNNELHVKVETISVEKANTIAIYDNETMFNGHYKEKVKMSVINLIVTGNVAGTPFVQGSNAIVIPTELFIETKLNSYLERDKLEDTPLYSAIEGEYEFISVGRNGSTDEGCDEVDFVIVRFNIDASDAMEVLTMLTTIIVNDTTGEEVEKYEYQSTKLDGVDAVLMNLHKEVLGYIPWYCNFANSPQGDEPTDFFEFWAEGFVGIIMAVAYFFYMIGMAIVQLFQAIVEFVTAVVMAVLTFLGPLLWLIIRAVLLVLAFILLALHLIAQIPLYIMMGIAMLIITAFMGGYCEFSWNFVEFSFDNERVFRMQSDIVWVYWDFFDMSFPWVDDKIIIDGEVIMSSKDSILGMGSEPETDISEDEVFSEVTQTPPSLKCGYNQTIGSTYNFYTTYQDFEGDAPDPSYGVKLHLIKPDGNALTPYAMSVHPDYVGSTDYEGGILYNYTIDLDTIYQGQGLWHYYFTTEDNSGTHDTVFMPQEGYMLGPINSSVQYLLSNTVSTNYPDEYYRPSGFKTDNFTFVSTWWSEIVPDNVYMCLVPANISTGTGVSKTVGIQKFEMSPIEQSPDYNDFVDYYCTVNFTELGYSDEEIGRFNHYYEAIYDNGNKTYLYDFGEDVESADYYDLIYHDFRTPYVGSPEAQLLDYHFEGANFLSSALLNLASGDTTLTGNWVLLSEMQLRFEVIYMDPSGNPPLEDYPQLTFVRVSNGEELIPYVMDEEITSEFSAEHGFEVYSYSCVIDVFDLPPGVWKFKFDARDSEGLPLDTLYGNEKLWMQGSGMEIMNGFSLTTLTAGTIPLIGYIISLPLSNGGIYSQIAAAVIAIAGTVYGMWQLGSTFFNLVQSKNTGALLGLCLGTFFSCLGTSNAFAQSFASIAKYIGNIVLFLMMVETLISLVAIPLKFIDTGGWLPMVLNFVYLPIEFFLLIATSIVGNIMMNSFGRQTNTGNKVVKACMKMMVIFQALVSIASFISWITITEGWALLS